MRRYALKPGELKGVFRGRRVADSAFFRIAVLPGKFSGIRFTVLAPKAVDKRAVARNRTKRRVKEWLRKNLFLLNRLIGFAVFVKSPAARADKKRFYSELERVFAKL